MGVTPKRKYPLVTLERISELLVVTNFVHRPCLLLRKKKIPPRHREQTFFVFIIFSLLSKILLVRWGPSGPPIPRFELSVFFLYHLWWLRTLQVLHPSTTVSFFFFFQVRPSLHLPRSRKSFERGPAGVFGCTSTRAAPCRTSGSCLRLSAQAAEMREELPLG